MIDEINKLQQKSLEELKQCKIDYKEEIDNIANSLTGMRELGKWGRIIQIKTILKCIDKRILTL